MLSQNITGIKVVQDNIVKVTFQLTNIDLETGFNWREVGIIAEDPDTQTEVLFVYGNAGDNGEYISPGGETDILEKYININLIVSNTENVTATIDKSLVYVTEKELEDKINTIEYENLSNKPAINGNELNKESTTENLGLDDLYKPKYIKDYTLDSTGEHWITDPQKNSLYYYKIDYNEITEQHRVNIYMDLENQVKLTDAYTNTDKGHIYIYTSEKPTEDIKVNLEIILIRESKIV